MPALTIERIWTPTPTPATAEAPSRPTISMSASPTNDSTENVTITGHASVHTVTRRSARPAGNGGATTAGAALGTSGDGNGSAPTDTPSPGHGSRRPPPSQGRIVRRDSSFVGPTKGGQRRGFFSAFESRSASVPRLAPSAGFAIAVS